MRAAKEYGGHGPVTSSARPRGSRSSASCSTWPRNSASRRGRHEVGHVQQQGGAGGAAAAQRLGDVPDSVSCSRSAHSAAVRLSRRPLQRLAPPGEVLGAAHAVPRRRAAPAPARSPAPRVRTSRTPHSRAVPIRRQLLAGRVAGMGAQQAAGRGLVRDGRAEAEGQDRPGAGGRADDGVVPAGEDGEAAGLGQVVGVHPQLVRWRRG